MKVAIALAAGLITATAAHAGGTYDAGGKATGTAETTIDVVSEGHMLMVSTTTYQTFDGTSADNPFNGMTGTCRGAMEIKVPAASGQGYCSFVDAGGDKNFNTFTVTGMGADGALVGRWSVVGGTGKYQGATGGGTFSSLTDREGGTFANSVEGAITLK